ncbi:MAG TPA: extracellular solute-binding protein, partial [Spirochaetia bacterium]|nr:extracellular solute-binding protein [Spirochaetia bacterium]
QLTPHFLSILHDFNLLTPLDRYLNQNNLKRRYPIDVDSGRIGKSLFAVTWALSPFILYVNRNVLKRAGIIGEAETLVPESLDQLMELCTRVNRAGKANTWGISLPLSPADPVFLWLYPYFLSFGGGFSNGIGNIIIDSGENRNALSWLSELYREGAVPGIKGVIEGRVMFASDQIAFWIDGPWARGTFRQISGFREEFDSHYTVCRIPAGPSGRSESILFNHQLGISRQCRNIESACRWVEFLTTDEETAKYYFEQTGSIPPMRDNLHKPFFEQDPFASVCIEQMETVSALPIRHPFFTKSLAFISQIISRSIARSGNPGGHADPGEGLELSKEIINMIGQNAYLGFYPH